MKKLLFALLMMVVSYAVAQNRSEQANIDSLRQRIVEVEKKLTARETELVELKRNLNLIHDKTIEAKEKAVLAEEIAIKTNRALFKEEYGWLAGGLTLIITVMGFFIGWFGLRKYIEGRAIVHIDKFLESEKWTNALKVKINKQLAENKLKDEVKILVISKDDDSEKVLKDYFQENEFNEKKIIYKRGPEVVFNNIDFDILFINNQNNLFDLPEKSIAPTPTNSPKNTTDLASGKDTSLSTNTTRTNTEAVTTVLDALIKDVKVTYASRNYAVFYFNDGGVILPKELDKGLHSSYANSLASLYHNLLDLMRYKYVVLDDKHLD